MKRPIAVLGRGKQMLITALLFFVLPCAFAQNTGTVTGTVMSPDGDMLTGVTVVATNSTDKSETHSATTNEKGVFVFRNLRMGSMYNFLVSYVGYETETVNRFSVRDANNSILIRMTQTDKSLGEVVVIGYGTQRRETVTGSIATIKAEDFNAGQINDPMTLIAGKVAGLSISNTNRSDPNA